MISIKDLKFTYSKNAWLFDGLSAGFEAGKIYGLLGKNGAGKTTLLKLILGLRYAHSGKVEVLGFDSYRRLPAMLSQVYLIPEQFSLPPMRALEYIGIYSPFYPQFDQQKMMNLMTEFDLEPAKRLNEMSYGQQKKFIVSFALASNVPVVLMDEPTNGLDIPSKMKFRQLVAQSLDNSRLFVISTHQVKDVEGLIDHLKIIDNGRMLLEKDLDEITDKLVFTKTDELTGQELFANQVFGGWEVILPRTGQPQTQVDLELLFTAVVQKDQKLLQFLNSKTREK